MEKAEQEHQEARIKAEAAEAEKSNPDSDAVKEGPEEQIHDDHGIKEPEKEPHKLKRDPEADTDPDPDLDNEPVLEIESSGLAHLRRRRLVDVI